MSKQNLEQFMLRKQRHRKMIQNGDIPSSTPEKFIVPCFERSLGFRTNQFAKHSEKLEDYIDRVTFERFVRDANRIIDTQLLEKAKKENSDYFCMTSIWLKISILLGILTFSVLCMIVYMNFTQTQETIILNISIVLIMISVVIASLCPIYLYLRKYEDYDYEAVIKIKLDKLAENENMRFNNEGQDYLKWKFQKLFFWLQLHINISSFEEKSRRLIHRFGSDTPPFVE